MSKQKRELNFELELLPIISILAVCICLLLLVMTWVPLGVISTQQALGENAESAPKENPPSIFAAIHDNGEIDLQLKDAPQAAPHLVHAVINSTGGQLSIDQLNRYLQSAKQEVPNLKTVVVMPHHTSKVDDVIKMMDVFRKNQFTDVGISPF